MCASGDVQCSSSSACGNITGDSGRGASHVECSTILSICWTSGRARRDVSFLPGDGKRDGCRFGDAGEKRNVFHLYGSADGVKLGGIGTSPREHAPNVYVGLGSEHRTTALLGDSDVR